MKIATTIEQSKRLAKILPIESADMYWDYDVKKKEYYLMVMDEQFDDMCIPAWSVSALMELMPMVNGREPHLIWTKGTYTCFYYCGHNTTKETIIDTCVDMLEWLIENNFLKIEKQHE